MNAPAPLPAPNPAEPSPPAITADYVHVVSQTLPDISDLDLDVATALAHDAEYYIRHLIHIAKKHMRHANSFHLTVRHIQHANKFVARHNPTFGHASSPHALHFEPVHQCPGLFVTRHPILPLSDILNAPLPPPSPSISVSKSALVVPHQIFATSNRPAHLYPHPTVAAIVALLKSNRPHFPNLDKLLRTLATSHSIPLQPVLTVIRDAVHTHAHPDGSTHTLHNALRLTSALVSRPTVGVEFFEDTALSIILTCLLSPNLGRGDVHALRQTAADILKHFLSHIADDFIRQRVCNTLDAALTHSMSTLSSLFGAVTGLALLGPYVFQPVFLPHMKSLISSLDKIHDHALQASRNDAHDIHTDLVYLCKAIERAMTQCRLLAPDPILPDVIL